MRRKAISFLLPGSAETSMVLSPIGGMDIPSLSRKEIHPSRTSMRSLRHSSIVSPVAMTPRRPGTVAQYPPSSIGSRSARARAAWMYSENIAEGVLWLRADLYPFPGPLKFKIISKIYSGRRRPPRQAVPPGRRDHTAATSTLIHPGSHPAWRGSAGRRTQDRPEEGSTGGSGRARSTRRPDGDPPRRLKAEGRRGSEKVFY